MIARFLAWLKYRRDTRGMRARNGTIPMIYGVPAYRNGQIDSLGIYKARQRYKAELLRQQKEGADVCLR